MPRYLIETPHSPDTVECNKIIKLFLESGSHLLSNADWGCKDGVHKSWFIGEFESKEEAMHIVPSLLRHDTTIIEIVKFKKKEKSENS